MIIENLHYFYLKCIMSHQNTKLDLIIKMKQNIKNCLDDFKSSGRVAGGVQVAVGPKETVQVGDGPKDDEIELK